MERRSIMLPKSKWKELDREAAREKVGTSEIIRRRLGVTPGPRAGRE